MLILLLILLWQQPVDHMTIGAYSTKTRAVVQEIVTDKDGKFTFHLPAGTYRFIPASRVKYHLFWIDPCERDAKKGMCEVPTVVSRQDFSEVVLRKEETELNGRLAEFDPSVGRTIRVIPD